MKRTLQIALLAALSFCVAGVAVAYDGTYTPGAGVIKSPHDLTPGNGGMGYGANPADSLQRVCIFCHAPHNTYKLAPENGGPDGLGAGPTAPTDYTYLPLWNHTPSLNDAYSMYDNGPGAPQSGPKAAQSIGLMMGPGPSSLLCLSCHDGSVAVNSYGNSAQLSKSQSLGGGGKMALNYTIGGDSYLGNHHPIGFQYAAVQSVDQEGIIDATSADFGAAGKVIDHLYGDGQMECGTCHSVHNKGNAGETLLWKSDQASGLCLTCHNK